MNKKMNNKGFSLVELIVVIAIMGILAVTLAPRLTQYVERAREAADEDTINTLLSTAKLISTEHPLPTGTTIRLTGANHFLTSADGVTWTVNTGYANGNTQIQAFFDNLETTLPGSIKLKSASAGANTHMVIATNGSGAITVALDYSIVDSDLTDSDDDELGVATNYVDYSISE